MSNLSKRIYTLKTHVDMIHSPEREEREKVKCICPICHKKFNRSRDVKRHQETIHNRNKNSSDDSHYLELISKITELQSELQEFKGIKTELKERDEKLKERDEKLMNEIITLKQKPNNVTNQVLQIVCVTSKDNYLDMLTDQMGNFDQAIDYIKDCALSDLVGDCKLIEKIYATPGDDISFTVDNKNSKIIYHNEKNEQISENRDLFARKLANNLQNTYLK